MAEIKFGEYESKQQAEKKAQELAAHRRLANVQVIETTEGYKVAQLSGQHLREQQEQIVSTHTPQYSYVGGTISVTAKPTETPKPEPKRIDKIHIQAESPEQAAQKLREKVEKGVYAASAYEMKEDYARTGAGIFTFTATEGEPKITYYKVQPKPKPKAPKVDLKTVEKLHLLPEMQTKQRTVTYEEMQRPSGFETLEPKPEDPYHVRFFKGYTKTIVTPILLAGAAGKTFLEYRTSLRDRPVETISMGIKAVPHLAKETATDIVKTIVETPVHAAGIFLTPAVIPFKVKLPAMFGRAKVKLVTKLGRPITYEVERLVGIVRGAKVTKAAKKGVKGTELHYFEKPVITKETVKAIKPPRPEPFKLKSKTIAIKEFGGIGETVFTKRTLLRVHEPVPAPKAKIIKYVPEKKIKPTPFEIKQLQTKPISASAASRSETYMRGAGRPKGAKTVLKSEEMPSMRLEARYEPIIKARKVYPEYETEFLPIPSGIAAPTFVTTFKAPEHDKIIPAERSRLFEIIKPEVKLGLTLKAEHPARMSRMSLGEVMRSRERLRYGTTTRERLRERVRVKPKVKEKLLKKPVIFKASYRMRTPLLAATISYSPMLKPSKTTKKASSRREFRRKYKYKPSLLGIAEVVEPRFKIPKTTTGLKIRPLIRRKKK